MAIDSVFFAAKASGVLASRCFDTYILFLNVLFFLPLLYLNFELKKNT